MAYRLRLPRKKQSTRTRLVKKQVNVDCTLVLQREQDQCAQWTAGDAQSTIDLHRLDAEMTGAHSVHTHTESTPVVTDVVHTIADTLTDTGWTVVSTNLGCWLDADTIRGATALRAKLKCEIEKLRATHSY